MRKIFLLLALLPFIMCMRANAAAQYCVNSAATLQKALDTAQANGDDDYICIVAGFMPLTAGLTSISTEPHNLILVGGFDAGCNSRAGQTTLDGQGMVRPLFIANNSGNVLIQGINFQNGYAQGADGGLYFSCVSGNASMLLSRFTDNVSLTSAGGIYAKTNTGSLFVFSNGIFRNHSNQVGGMLLDQAGVGYVINNTVHGNRTTVLTVPSGILLKGAGHFDLSNNLIWSNTDPGGAAFRADTAHGRRHNDIEFVADSVAPDLVVGEQSVDPQFEYCGLLCLSFHLSATSPLIDAGSDEALQGLAPDLRDLDFLPRILGEHVDIGAYEYTGIFANGFDF